MRFTCGCEIGPSCAIHPHGELPAPARAPETPAVEPSDLVRRLLEKFSQDRFTGGVNKRKLDGAFVSHCVDCLNDSDQQHDEDCAFPLLKEAAAVIAVQAREIAALKEALAAQIGESRRLLRDRDAFWLRVEEQEKVIQRQSLICLDVGGRIEAANNRAEAAETALTALTQERDALKEVLRGSQDVCSVQIQEQRRRAEAAEQERDALKAQLEQR
jgi:hypothetical protein